MTVASLLWIHEHIDFGGRRRALGIGQHDDYRVFDRAALAQIGFQDAISSCSLESEHGSATEAYFFEHDTDRFAGRWACLSTRIQPETRTRKLPDFRDRMWDLNDRVSAILLIDRPGEARQHRRSIGPHLESFARSAFFAAQVADIGDGELTVHDPQADWYGFPHSAPAGMATTSSYARVRYRMDVRINGWFVLPATHYNCSVSIYIGITMQGSRPVLTIVGTAVDVSSGMYAAALRSYLRSQVAQNLETAKLRLIDVSPFLFAGVPPQRDITGIFFLPGDRSALDDLAAGTVDAGGVTLVTAYEEEKP